MSTEKLDLPYCWFSESTALLKSIFTPLPTCVCLVYGSAAHPSIQYLSFLQIIFYYYRLIYLQKPRSSKSKHKIKLFASLLRIDN